MQISNSRPVHGLIALMKMLRQAIAVSLTGNDEIPKPCNFLQSVYESAPYPILTFDQNCVVKSFNKAAEELFEYKCSEVIEYDLSKLLLGENEISQKNNTAATKIPQSIGKNSEVEAVKKNGEKIPVVLLVTEIVIDNVKHYAAFLQDNSAQRVQQVENNQAQKMEAMGQLAAGIAHEINTPIQYIGDNLHAISCNFNDLIELLKKCQGELEEHSIAMKLQWQQWADHYDLNFIHSDVPVAIQQSIDGVKKVSEIVNAMKAFSHSDSQKIELANINEMIKNTLIICRNEYKYIARVETCLALDLPEIECFPSEINQVLLNLIINAAHAIEEKQTKAGLIEIRSMNDGDYVNVIVKDNGPGISKDIRDRVFNLFFTTKKIGKGSGQGLSIAHKIIVEKHKGFFYFDTEEGEGTTFYLKLPITRSKF